MLRSGTFALTALLAALSAIGPLTTDRYLPSLPAIVRQLVATTAQGQLTISAYLVGFAVGQIVYGPVSDRYGRKPVLIGALVVYCVASLACALSSSIGMLIGARALQALGGCGGIVLARAIVRDLYAGARAGRELSLIASVMALAPVLAPIAGGLLQSGFGWRSVFLTLLVLGLAGIAVIWLLLPETLTRRAEPLSFSSMLASYRVMARHPAYLAYMALATTSYAGLFAWISGASFVLQDLYHLSPFTFSIAFAVGSVGYMAGSALAARLVVPLGIDGTIGIGTVASAAGGLVMAVAIGFDLPWWLSLVLAMSIYLAGMGMVLPQSTAGAMMPFPERAGAASALLGFVQQSGAALCGVAVGHWLGASAWPLVSAVALMGSVSLLLWIGTRTLREQVAAHP
jgi:DHA1 family bicyclomycin/chloramphenicol resistance-like MFS transporter